MVNNLLFLVILAAFLPAPIVYLLGRNVGKKVSWLVLGIFLLSTVVFGSLIPVVEHEILLEEYSWVAEPVKLTLGFMADGLSIPMVFTYIFVFTGATLFSIPYMEKRFSLDDVEDTNENYARFYTFFLLYGGSVAGCMLSTNLIEFFMFFELALVFSWLLILLFGYIFGAGTDQSYYSLYYLPLLPIFPLLLFLPHLPFPGYGTKHESIISTFRTLSPNRQN